MLLVLLLASCSGSTKSPQATETLELTSIPEGILPSESELTALLQRVVDEEHRATGMVIGMVAPDEEVIVGYGKLSESGGRVPDAESLFEIGSISKTFIGVLLADAVQRGEVRLDDPVAMYLPTTVKMPQYRGVQITLLDLATHTSGLPGEVLTDPSQELTAETWVPAMYDFLSSYQLTYRPGTSFEYSNLGMTLLAHILELRTGVPYQQLLQERLLQPLEMSSTGFQPDAALISNLATGHTSVLHPVDRYEYSVPEHLYVGGVLSSAEDMLKYLSAAMGLRASSLTTAFQASLEPRHVAGTDMCGLAWRVQAGAYPMIYHAGQTTGMHAYLGFDPQQKIGVIVLANAAVAKDDIGMHLLHPTRYVLETYAARAVPTPHNVDPDVLASYAGDYRFEELVMTIRVDGDRLRLSVPGQELLTMIPQTETEFVVVEYEATVRFKRADGRVTGLMLDQATASQVYTFLKVDSTE